MTKPGAYLSGFAWLKFIYHRWCRRRLVDIGWRLCSSCRGFHRFIWVKDWILFEDEPPMFVHYECAGCGRRTDTIASTVQSAADSSGADPEKKAATIERMRLAARANTQNPSDIGGKIS